MARDRKLRDVIIQAACNKEQTTLDGVFNEVLIDYHSNEITHDIALARMILKQGDKIKHESHPCVYVPW